MFSSGHLPPRTGQSPILCTVQWPCERRAIRAPSANSRGVSSWLPQMSRRGAAERGGVERMWSRTGASRSARALASLRESGSNSRSIDDLDVTRQHLREQCAPGVGDGDRDAALVVRGGGARHQAPLLEQARLVGQAAAAVDDAVGQVGHAVAARRRVAEAGQQLELHVAEVSGLAQLLLDRMSKQADHLDQGEVGAELDGVEDGGGSGMPESYLLRIRSGATS